MNISTLDESLYKGEMILCQTFLSPFACTLEIIW